MNAANDNQRPRRGNAIIAIIAALVALLMSSMPAAAAVACEPSQTARAKTWRLVDGRRCWVPRKIARDQLYWPAARKREPAAAADPLLTSYWPPLPVTFADRWRDVLRQLTGN